MSCEEKVDKAKLERNISLLKEQYAKLQNAYADLDNKYRDMLSSTPVVNKNISSFVSCLVMTVTRLYNKSLYSDIKIRIGGGTKPAHKFVLQARSEDWNEEILNSIGELDWSSIEEDIGNALLRWIYTDFVDLQNDRIVLGLLRAAHCFKLIGLSQVCEHALVTSANIRTCVKFYCVAEEVSAKALLEHCSDLMSIHWNDLTAQEFEQVSAPLLFKILKNKTKYPLHAAVRLLREDVVFLCLVENSNKIAEISNCISDQGHLPLQLALTSKNLSIAETLVKNGFANINAYDAEGFPLIVRSIQDSDEFAANFLLDHGCQINLTARSSGNTAIHIICDYDPLKTDKGAFESIISIARKIMTLDPDVNVQNVHGETPLHKAILSGNNEMVEMILSVRNLDINLQTIDDKTALELSLLNKTDSWRIPTKLIELGANVNRIKASTQDNLLQVLTKNSLEKSAIFLSDYSDVNYIDAEGFSVLHLAAKMCLSNLVAKLLKIGANPNVQLEKSQMKTPIHLAVEANAIGVLEKIVNLKYSLQELMPDFNAKDSNGYTPLSLSIKLGRNHLISVLIAGGANVNARIGEGLTLLHQSILNKDTETALLLLQHGADACCLTGDKKSPLRLAIQSHMPKVVDYLCAERVALNLFIDDVREPPLWTSLELGYEDIAQILLRHGADTDCWDAGPHGCIQTLLHRAIDEKKELIAIFLIKSQCDIDAPRQPGPNGEEGDEANDKASPLHICCQWGLTKVLKALIDHGANVNALDVDNQTPIQIAIRYQHEEIISILLCHPNIDLRTRDKEGNTPFAQALIVRNYKVAERVLGRLPNAAEQMDHRGRNFLHLAILKNDLEETLFLLSVKVDINSRVHDVGQSTPLHLAASSQNEMIMRTLILAGARVSERDAIQKTPLHIAAERGNLIAITALLQNNIDYDAVDDEGNNALHIAVRKGYLNIVRELLTESRINAEVINNKGRTPLHELCRTGEDIAATAICDLFIECMPIYPINMPDADGNTPLLLAFMRGQSPLCKALVKYGACLGAENRDGINIFNFKLATDQLLHSLLDQLPQESPWSESDVCQECRIKFSLTIRKHHCRHCGRVLCSKCSNNEAPILKFGFNKPTRVCFKCFDVLHGGCRFSQ